MGNLCGPTTKEVLDKPVDGDWVPIDLSLQFEAVLQPVTPRRNDAQLCRMTDRHRLTCQKLQATEETLLSARQALAHQKKMHDEATGRLQAQIDDLQAQVIGVLKTRRCGIANVTQTPIRELLITYPYGCEDFTLSCPEAPPPPGGHPSNGYPASGPRQASSCELIRIDKHHAAWYPSFPFFLKAWVARGSLFFLDSQFFPAHF